MGSREPRRREARARAMEERKERDLEDGQDGDGEDIRGERPQHDGSHVVPGVESGGEDLHVERRVVVAKDPELEREQRRGGDGQRDPPRAGGREEGEGEKERDGARRIDDRARSGEPCHVTAKDDVEDRELAHDERERERRCERRATVRGQGIQGRQCAQDSKGAGGGPRW